MNLYFNHTHPSPNSSQTHSLSPHPSEVHAFLDNVSCFCCLYTHEYGAYRSVVDQPGATLLRKTDCPFPRSHLLGVDAQESLPTPYWNGGCLDFV